jgi:hypothetical protein
VAPEVLAAGPLEVLIAGEPGDGAIWDVAEGENESGLEDVEFVF